MTEAELKKRTKDFAKQITLESSLLDDLTKESDELVAIIVSSIKTAKRNYK